MTEDSADDVPTNVRASSGWQAVLDDAEATADEYRERGWTALVVHPGDAVMVDSERRRGLDVVVPDPEYDEVASLVAAHEFDDVAVFRAEDDGLVYLLVVERATAAAVAVLVPGYYDPGAAGSTLSAIRDAGEISLFCRRLGDESVEFVHDDPTPFLPASPE